MTALCSGVSHCTQSTDAGPRVILDDSRLQRWGTWRGTQDSSMPAGTWSPFSLCQWLNAKTLSHRDWRHLETLEFFPHHLPATGQLSLFSEYLGGKPEKKGSEEGLRQQSAVNCRCGASPACSTAISLPPQVGLPFTHWVHTAGVFSTHIQR